MIKEQALTEPDATPPRDPWSGWARLADVPAPAEDKVVAVEVPPAPEPVPAAEAPPALAPAAPPPNDDLVAAVARLAAELADERRLRAAAEDSRRQADARLRESEAGAARAGAELAAATARIAELERDRDEVIRRAEELLTAVRERADQRLAAELDSAGRHWSELLEEERRRAEALDAECASLAQRVHDAWLAAAVLRRSRPLRRRSSTPTTPDAAEKEVLDDLDEHEVDPALSAESPELAEEIERLRQRLRGRVHRPPQIDEVEDGVDELREARLARDAEGKGRRRR